MLFCNINFNQKNKNELFDRCPDNKTKFIITANAAFIVEANNSKRFFDILNNNYITFDGNVPYIVAKILTKLRLLHKGKYIMTKFDFEKLSGSDIIYDFCKFARKNNFKMFLLGGKEETNKITVYVLQEKYKIAITGYSPFFEEYPFSDNFTKSCIDKIRLFKPEILFVGFGTPKQEYWLDDNKAILSEIGVQYAVGCGGTFDFVSNKIKRAPVFIQKIGLEIVYRFFQEPNRLRYKRLIDSLKFFKYIWHKPDFKQLDLFKNLRNDIIISE
jgi:N-acetylglucosaminyldiphosphoundecaprenol N-acetyl-beta-D-mannosaminyltransferase